jgi:hypothetical protein
MRLGRSGDRSSIAGAAWRKLRECLKSFRLCAPTSRVRALQRQQPSFFRTRMHSMRNAISAECGVDFDRRDRSDSRWQTRVIITACSA